MAHSVTGDRRPGPVTLKTGRMSDEELRAEYPTWSIWYPLDGRTVHEECGVFHRQAMVGKVDCVTDDSKGLTRMAAPDADG